MYFEKIEVKNEQFTTLREKWNYIRLHYAANVNWGQRFVSHIENFVSIDDNHWIECFFCLLLTVHSIFQFLHCG